MDSKLLNIHHLWKTASSGASWAICGVFTYPPIASFEKALKNTISWFTYLPFVTTCVSVAFSTTVSDIQGSAWQSPLAGQIVHNVTGLVTAKGLAGFWIAGERSQDLRVSNGLNIFTTSASVLNQVAIGDFVSLSGKVAEFRSKTLPNDLFATEIDSPANVTILSRNNTITPVVLGRDRSPPTLNLTALDFGPDGFLSVPNNVTLIEAVNAPLEPNLYGLDFWESLEGQLVEIPKPVALGFENRFGEFWVHGDWKVTGKNKRGGLTLTFGPGGIPDSNPEAILVGSPLDQTKNPAVALGTVLTNITGVVAYQFGFFYVLPTTAPTIVSRAAGIVQPTQLTSKPLEDCVITFGDYNLENMGPKSPHLPAIANHIATYLNTPDIMFLQEIEDNSGEMNDGTVLGNVTLATLVKAIANTSNIGYDFIEIPPIDGQDGGVPGGNIRQAYLYRTNKLTLVPGSPIGGPLDRIEVETTPSRVLRLNFNPGRIDPSNLAWKSSRKPLVAEWQTPGGQKLFTINVHLASKSGSSSIWGDARPPVNSPLETRTSQIALVASFAKSILAIDERANILIAGDFNEYLPARALYKPLVDALHNIDSIAGIPEVERYSYIFDQNSEQLDHAFISQTIKERGVEFEHIHINNWAPTFKERISDHDPSVGRIRLC